MTLLKVSYNSTETTESLTKVFFEIYLRICYQDGMITNINIRMPAFSAQILSENLLDQVRFQQEFEGGFNKHEGRITDVELWDNPLTEEEMKQWTLCE